MWGYKGKLTDEEIATFVVEHYYSFSDFIYQMKEKNYQQKRF